MVAFGDGFLREGSLCIGLISVRALLVEGLAVGSSGLTHFLVSGYCWDSGAVTV